MSTKKAEFEKKKLTDALIRLLLQKGIKKTESALEFVVLHSSVVANAGKRGGVGATEMSTE